MTHISRGTSSLPMKVVLTNRTHISLGLVVEAVTMSMMHSSTWPGAHCLPGQPIHKDSSSCWTSYFLTPLQKFGEDFIYVLPLCFSGCGAHKSCWIPCPGYCSRILYHITMNSTIIAASNNTSLFPLGPKLWLEVCGSNCIGFCVHSLNVHFC